MTDPRPAEAAWAAALAAWQSIYVKEAAPLGGMLADEVSVPLDPFPSDGHRPCWCPCTKAHPGEDVCDMEGVVSRPPPQQRSARSTCMSAFRAGRPPGSQAWRPANGLRAPIASRPEYPV